MIMIKHKIILAIGILFLRCQISAQKKELALSTQIETSITFYAPIKRIELGDQRAYSLNQIGRKIYIKARKREAAKTILKVTLADGKHLEFNLKVDEENTQKEVIIKYTNQLPSFSIPYKIVKLAESRANTHVRKKISRGKYLEMNGILCDGQQKYVRFLAININPSEIIFLDEYKRRLLSYRTETINGRTYLFIAISKEEKITVTVNGKNFKF